MSEVFSGTGTNQLKCCLLLILLIHDFEKHFVVKYASLSFLEKLPRYTKFPRPTRMLMSYLALVQIKKNGRGHNLGNSANCVKERFFYFVQFKVNVCRLVAPASSISAAKSFNL